MTVVANEPRLPPLLHTKNGISLSEFQLSPLSDPRDGWETASTTGQYGGVYFHPDSTSGELLVDKHLNTSVTFPEGGRRAWLVVLGSWCALFSSLGLMNTIGTFHEHITTHQLKELDVATVGWIFSLYAFLTFGVGLFVGPVFDKYGPRWLILSGSVLVVLCMDLIGNCTQFSHFLITFSILGGVGSALLFSPSIAIIGHYFGRRRGFATGIAATGGAFGGILYPLILQILTPKIGFIWATKLIALISLILCSIANISMQPNLKPGRTAHAWPNLFILKHKAFALTVAGVFLLEFALFVPLTYITSYATSQGLSSSLCAAVLPIVNVGSVFGRCLSGYYADKYGRFNIAILALAITVVSVLGIWLPFGNTGPGLIIFAFLFGLSSGSNISLTPVCIGQLCDVQQYGRYYSTCFSIVSLGCLTGVPFAGIILNASKGNYNGLVLLVGACYAGGLLTFLGARIMIAGWGARKKY